MTKDLRFFLGELQKKLPSHYLEVEKEILIWNSHEHAPRRFLTLAEEDFHKV
jgi:hypothetical protein